MSRILPADFFARDTLTVAQELVGQTLVRKTRKGIIRQIIAEVEAYDGPEDKASHASKGFTERTKVMFGPPGYWYIYFIYGMYWMLNIVTGDEGYPAAVLIRSTEDISGPGRLTRELRINGELNGMPASRESGLWIEKGSNPAAVEALPRVGVSYAGEWAMKPYRFVKSG